MPNLVLEQNARPPLDRFVMVRYFLREFDGGVAEFALQHENSEGYSLRV